VQQEGRKEKVLKRKFNPFIKLFKTQVSFFQN
jgi:hypothetical protein